MRDHSEWVMWWSLQVVRWKARLDSAKMSVRPRFHWEWSTLRKRIYIKTVICLFMQSKIHFRTDYIISPVCCVFSRQWVWCEIFKKVCMQFERIWLRGVLMCVLGCVLKVAECNLIIFGTRLVWLYPWCVMSKCQFREKVMKIKARVNWSLAFLSLSLARSLSLTVSLCLSLFLSVSSVFHFTCTCLSLSPPSDIHSPFLSFEVFVNHLTMAECGWFTGWGRRVCHSHRTIQKRLQKGCYVCL